MCSSDLLAAEQLAEHHGITLSDETLRRWLQAAGVDHFQRRKRPHRAWRERKAHVGELIHLDGSHHDWLEGRGPRCVLMAYIDDASSRVYARFYEYEGTIPAMDSFTRYVRGMEFPSRSMRIGIRPISRSPRRRWRSSWRVGSPRVSLGGRWTNWGAS